MGKLIVIAMMVGLVWVGATLYTEGARHAFGGAFSFLAAGDDLPERASEYASTPQRVGARAERSIQEGAARYEHVAED